VKWWTKAARQGHVLAQVHLGLIYQTGTGVIQSDKEATKWYTMAAEQGNADAQYMLGFIYSLDPENAEMPLFYRLENRVGLDYNQAVKWLTKAATQGHADAQYMLGDMYEHGQGVAEDYVQAYKWMILATAQLGVQDANGKEAVRKELMPEQVAEAERLAKEFRPVKSEK
jgi:TPR repeat protein